jgi:oxidase EvaA
MNHLVNKFILSWANESGNVHTTEDLLGWIKELNASTYVNINECSINESTFWFYDDYNGEVLNRKRSFFSIKGMRRFENGEFTGEQPIIIQPEIGYLGIICKEINGVLNFLMQAKIEPGNINCVQISPTIQATKSNFTRAHGGKFPTYFEMFEHSDKYDVIYDQIQSEQATRFYKKRNRNIIMVVNEKFEIYPNFRWMTLGQIKVLMQVDNLVNMDTRTVLSGIPFVTQLLSDTDKRQLIEYFRDQSFFHSIFAANIQESLPRIYQKLNNFKMFRDVMLSTVPLGQLVDWRTDEFGITCKKQANFMVRYYDIEISGREVQHWSQPLFKAIGMATFGLVARTVDGKKEFLVKIKSEIGSFDKVEIGPTVQWEASHYLYNDDDVEKLFRKRYECKKGILTSVVLSEEGGRFFHEQNKNVILEIDPNEITVLPEDYVWTDYATLNYLIQVNNCLNIQLRNLLSLLRI